MLQYEDDLKTNLAQYSKLVDQKKIIEEQLDKIKDGINKWLKLNEKIEYTCINDIGEEWKIAISSRKNTKIDKDILMTLLTQDQLNSVMSTNETTFLTCKKITSKIKSNTPIAPQGI